MYRRINPTSRQELPMRMLFQPLGNGTFHRACEADSFRGLVAALLDEPDYELADVETRLVARLRLADEVRLLAEVDRRQLTVADRDAPDTINVASDEPFIRSLDHLGFVSLEPTITSVTQMGAIRRQPSSRPSCLLADVRKLWTPTLRCAAALYPPWSPRRLEG